MIDRKGTRPIVLAIRGTIVAIFFGVFFLHPPFDARWTASILILAAGVIVPLGLLVIALERLGTNIDRLGRVAVITQILGAALLVHALLQQPQGRTAR